MSLVPAIRRPHLAASFALLLLAAPALAGEALTADAKVDAVTVYPDRAVVTREARIHVPAGESEILFRNLPPGFQQDSLQLTGSGVKATMLDVTTTMLAERAVIPSQRLQEIAQKIKDMEAETREMEKALRSHRRTIRMHTESQDNLRRQQDLVNRIEKECLEAPAPVPAAKEGVAPVIARPKVADYLELLQFSGAKAEEFKAALRKHDEAVEDERERMAEVERTLGELRRKIALAKAEGAPESTTSRVVSARISAAAAGELTLRLAYAVPGASWSPAYDVRLKERKAEVTCFGSVRQATGEDWTGAALTLSTARPALGGRAPSFSPWVLDAVRPPAASAESRYGGLELAAASPAVSADRLRGGAEDAAPNGPPKDGAEQAKLSAATVAYAGIHATFRVEHRVDIPTGGRELKVPIAQLDLAGKLQDEAAPALNENAYLNGYFKLEGEFPLLEGPSRVFLGDTFIAHDRIPTTLPGNLFMTSFGADDGVRIERKLVDRKTEVVGWTNGSLRTTYRYVFTVENRKKTAERVVFRDHLPVSRNDKIKVELKAPDKDACGKKPLTLAEALAVRKEATLEDDGEICWRLDLKPGDKREIPFTFTVEHPKDLPVAGM